MQETVKQDRDKYLGGSDIPIIMNLSPFKSRYDLLLEKAGYKEDTFEGNVYTEYGNKLEPKIREYINEINKERRLPYVEGKHTREAQADEIIGVRIHTDGENDFSILEIKTTSQIYPYLEDYKIYLVQLLFYMVNTGKNYGVLAVYNRPDDLSEEFDKDRLQIFEFDIGDYKDLVKEIGDACDKFIEDLKKVKDNPFITEEELLPTEISDIAARILAFEDQIKYMKAVEEKIQSEKERLREAMDAAGVPSWRTPNGYLSTRVKDGADKVNEVEELDEEALKRDLPELFKSIDDGGYIVIKKKVVKGKKGYIKITYPKNKEG